MRRPAVIVALACAVFLSCDSGRKQKPLSEPGEKLYAIRGKILSRDGGDNTIRLDHEAIPGFMEAMAMDYSIRGAEVKALPPDGSRVEAKLHVTGNGYWLTDVKKAP